MSKRVLNNLAKKYKNVKEGVGTITGGQVLDYEAKRIKNEAIYDMVRKMFENGITFEQVRKVASTLTDDEIHELEDEILCTK